MVPGLKRIHTSDDGSGIRGDLPHARRKFPQEQNTLSFWANYTRSAPSAAREPQSQYDPRCDC